LSAVEPAHETKTLLFWFCFCFWSCNLCQTL